MPEDVLRSPPAELSSETGSLSLLRTRPARLFLHRNSEARTSLSSKVSSCQNCSRTSAEKAMLTARSGARRRGLQAAPEEVREPPEHAGGRRKAPRLRAIAHREVCDERRGEIYGEAGVGPLLEPRRRRRKQQRHAEELGQRELHPEVGGEAEAGERFRHLRQAQLRVGGEAHLQAEERGYDPEADDFSFGAGHVQVRGREGRPGASTPNCFAYIGVLPTAPVALLCHGGTCCIRITRNVPVCCGCKSATRYARLAHLML